MSFLLINCIPQSLFRQLTVYFLTGVLVNGLGFLVFCLFVELGINSKLSMSILYVAGVVGSYVGNKNIGFKNKEGYLTGFVKFFFVYIVAYCINLFAHIYFVDFLDCSPYFVQGIMLMVISAFVFISLKLFVFR